MQRAMDDVNARGRERGLPEVEMGIGIHTGEVIVGNIGSEKRTKYGAVGAAINLAYRIESQTTGGQLLLGARTYEVVRDLVDVRGTLSLTLKGLDAPITIYEVAAIRGAYATAVPARGETPRVPIEPPVAMTCYRLDGKRLVGDAVAGRMRALSSTSVEALVDGALAERETVKLVVDGMDAYAKVIGRQVEGMVVMTFTDVSPDLRHWLEEKLATR
jgi:adenylate cyclase